MRAWLCGVAALLTGTGAIAAAPPYDERPATVTAATQGWDYERRIAEIPMRDGVKLHTVILVPKGAAAAPMLLTRTPYDANALTTNVKSGHLVAALDGYDNAADIIAEGGYIRVVQDIRGKYGSQGNYVMNRPLVGNPLNPTKVDDSTDAYDTIDWLVKHVPESNGRVGIIGISYDGYEPLVALVNPHPALKVSVPMNPMVDGWRGDDWFHNGAFRQLGTDYIFEQEATRDNSLPFTWNSYDLYDTVLAAGSAGELGRRHGMDQVGFWRQITQHPAYDSFWQSQAMDRILAAQPLKVPVMLVDQPVGRRGHLRRSGGLSGARAQGFGQRHGLSDARPLVPRPGHRPGPQHRRDPVGPGHVQMVAPPGARAVPRSLSQGRADGRGAGHRLPVGHQPMAAPQRLAGRPDFAAAVSQAWNGARLRAGARRGANRRLLVRPVASRHLRAAAGAGVEL